MTLPKTSVLVVDDDPRMLTMASRTLELEGYRLLTAASGEAALEILGKETPALMLLDIMMPGIDGFTVCRQVREFSQMPIIMVTARSSSQEKVAGLEAGADDYVVKPFSAQELVARVGALLRRADLRQGRSEPPLHLDHLTIDFTRHKVILGNQEIKLNATEYRLLCYLARHAGQALARDQVLEAMWGEARTRGLSLLAESISHLRQKAQAIGQNWPGALIPQEW